MACDSRSTTSAPGSSLRHILITAPDIIKLDRSIVAGAAADRVLRTLVRSLAEFGHDAGAQVVAEGVETLNDALALRDAGVDYGQGWLFGRPGPVEHLAEHYAVHGLNEPDDTDDSARRARL